MYKRQVKAPMPGTILKVNVQNGGLVKKGDVLVVLEAMKMENDIQAPADGTVSAVHVTAGTSVDTDEMCIRDRALSWRSYGDTCERREVRIYN